MQSKITAQLGPAYRPVIKVSEVRSEDSRDELVCAIREQLQKTSSTFRFDIIDDLTSRKDYFISPVPDELSYFLERILRLSPFGHKPDCPNALRIIKFFEDLKAVCVNPSDTEALKKFNDWHPTALNGEKNPDAFGEDFYNQKGTHK